MIAPVTALSATQLPSLHKWHTQEKVRFVFFKALTALVPHRFVCKLFGLFLSIVIIEPTLVVAMVLGMRLGLFVGGCITAVLVAAILLVIVSIYIAVCIACVFPSLMPSAHRRWEKEMAFAQVQSGDLQHVQFLIEQKEVPVDAKVGEASLLKEAVENKHYAIAQYLVKKGAEVSSAYSYARTIAEEGDKRFLDLLRPYVKPLDICSMNMQHVHQGASPPLPEEHAEVPIRELLTLASGIRDQKQLVGLDDDEELVSSLVAHKLLEDNLLYRIENRVRFMGVPAAEDQRELYYAHLAKLLRNIIFLLRPLPDELKAPVLGQLAAASKYCGGRYLRELRLVFEQLSVDVSQLTFESRIYQILRVERDQIVLQMLPDVHRQSAFIQLFGEVFGLSGYALQREVGDPLAPREVPVDRWREDFLNLYQPRRIYLLLRDQMKKDLKEQFILWLKHNAPQPETWYTWLETMHDEQGHIKEEAFLYLLRKLDVLNDSL